MQDYNTLRPDRGNVTFASLTATTDDAGIHCSDGPYTSTLRPAPTSDRPQDRLASPAALHSLAAQLLWVGKRHVSYLAALTDNTHRFSLLHWASHRPRGVSRGSTAGELLALADACAASLDVRPLLQELLNHRVPIDAYTDSATTCELITSFKDPADMSGKNDLYLLRRALLDGDLAEFNHIHGRDNPAEALSKPSFSRSAPTAAFSTALTSGILTTPVVSHTTTDDRCGHTSALVPQPPPCPPPLPTSGSPPPPPSTTGHNRLPFC
ncbi:hypothetical protein BU14_0289s0014 [Porphyra umbilicalis]|uniref:Uncharacterized protein n=1 Tax=Porphyra umbilicalis TaxID=2786 RepID=A0A1X6P0Y3_PORUM|nr:hypothetical protein BU14_0289s0014 [Porphyra umbilicalis]|eukprot:OSX74435.1 hypothetical protein BU14_0289s0014 [Porphyra umbilicalis]